MSTITNNHLKQKIVFIGGTTVGKTTLVATIEGLRELDSQYVPIVWDTIFMEVPIHTERTTHIVPVSLHDFSSQHLYEEVFYYLVGGATCIVACYSVVDQQSQFQLRDYWIPKIRAKLNKVPIIVCGLKLDLKYDSRYEYTSPSAVRQLLRNTENRGILECSAHDSMYRTGENEGSVYEVHTQALRLGLEFTLSMDKESKLKCMIL